jgi:hypothetical protein
MYISTIPRAVVRRRGRYLGDTCQIMDNGARVCTSDPGPAQPTPVVPPAVSCPPCAPCPKPVTCAPRPAPRWRISPGPRTINWKTGYMLEGLGDVCQVYANGARVCASPTPAGQVSSIVSPGQAVTTPVVTTTPGQLMSTISLQPTPLVPALSTDPNAAAAVDVAGGFDLQSAIANVPSLFWYAAGAGAVYFLFFKRK